MTDNEAARCEAWEQRGYWVAQTDYADLPMSGPLREAYDRGRRGDLPDARGARGEARLDYCCVCKAPSTILVRADLFVGGERDFLAYCSTHMLLKPDAQALAAAEARGRDAAIAERKKDSLDGWRDRLDATFMALDMGRQQERARWEAAIAQTEAEHPYDKTSPEHGNAYAEGWTDALDIVAVRACNAATPATEAE